MVVPEYSLLAESVSGPAPAFTIPTPLPVITLETERPAAEPTVNVRFAVPRSSVPAPWIVAGDAAFATVTFPSSVRTAPVSSQTLPPADVSAWSVLVVDVNVFHTKSEPPFSVMFAVVAMSFVAFA
jgi:hypothetical protein